MASNRGIAYVGPGKVEVRKHRLSEACGSGRQALRSRRDPEDRDHQYLRERSAHGARPHHGAAQA